MEEEDRASDLAVHISEVILSIADDPDPEKWETFCKLLHLDITPTEFAARVRADLPNLRREAQRNRN